MQIPELAAKLESLGLTDKQSKVYVAALFLGPASVQKISQQAGINRATAYFILDELAELGLVSQSTENKKTVFVAEPPEALDSLFSKQIEVLEARRNAAKEVIPQLKEHARGTAGKAPIIRFSKGKEGVDAFSSYLRRKARVGSEIYAFSNYDEVVRFYPDVLKFSPQARLKKKLRSKLIYSYKDEIKTDKKLMRETKKLKEPVMADMNLYEDMASIFTYSRTGNPADLTGILIESPEVVGALRQLFELAWQNVNKKSVK